MQTVQKICLIFFSFKLIFVHECLTQITVCWVCWCYMLMLDHAFTPHSKNYKLPLRMHISQTQTNKQESSILKMKPFTEFSLKCFMTLTNMYLHERIQNSEPFTGQRLGKCMCKWLQSHRASKHRLDMTWQACPVNHRTTYLSTTYTTLYQHGNS